MQKTLQDPYTANCKWFAPVELVRRLLLPIFIVIDPGNLVRKLSVESIKHYHIRTIAYSYSLSKLII